MVVLELESAGPLVSHRSRLSAWILTRELLHYLVELLDDERWLLGDLSLRFLSVSLMHDLGLCFLSVCALVGLVVLVLVRVEPVPLADRLDLTDMMAAQLLYDMLQRVCLSSGSSFLLFAYI